MSVTHTHTLQKQVVKCICVNSLLKCRIRKDFDNDLKFLLRDVSVLDFSGDSIPSEALIHGALAFPIGITNEGQALLAGAYYGLGRVVLVTHEAYFNKKVKLGI